MDQWIIPALSFLAVMGIGGAVLAQRRAKRQPLDDRLRELSQSPTEPRASRDRTWADRLMDAAEKVPAGKPSDKLRAQLAQAGYQSANAASTYLSLKLILLLGGLAVAGAAVGPTDQRLPMKLMIIGMVGGLLFFIPNLAVGLSRQKRCDQVRMRLPDAIDLLEICVTAGMGLDMAWNSVADEMRRVSPILADEMALTNLEMHLGGTRAAAMRNMAARTDSDELRSLVAILVQSERFGTSIAEALRTFAKSMREMRSQRAEESAEKMAVKLLFPMVVFIFPVVILVAAGPAGIILTQALGNG